MEASATEHAGHHDAAVEEVRRRWSAELRAAAEQLQRSGETSLRLAGCAIAARVVRFWRGNSMLEITARSDTWSAESHTRIPRDPRRLDRDVLVHYLANAAAHG